MSLGNMHIFPESGNEFDELRDELLKIENMRLAELTSKQRKEFKSKFGSIWENLNHHLESLERTIQDTQIIFDTAIEHSSTLENQFNINPEQMTSQWRQHDFVNRFSKEWLCLIDKEFTYRAANAKFIKAHKMSREDLIGKPITSLWGEELFKKKLKSSIECCFRGQENKKQVHAKFPGTGEVYLELSFYPFYEENSEEITHVLMYAHDISSRKVAEDLIKQQNIFLDKISDAILIQNEDGYITYWNKGCERIYGWTEEEAVGKETEMLLFRRVDRPQYKLAMDAYRHTGDWSGELQQIAKNKRTISINSNWHEYKNPRSSEKGILMINTNISHVKNLEQQFFRSQRVQSIGELTSGIAHDLNNVLSSFFLAIRALKPKLEDKQDQFILGMLENSANRGVNLVRQILAFAKGIDEQKEIHMNEICDDLESFIYETFPKKINFVRESDDALWKLFGNPTQIHQVLLNLCVNARDAMASKGTITIGIHNHLVDDENPYLCFNSPIPKGRYIHLSVQDTGVGIAKKDMDRIFTPFFTTKEAGKGTGLGLSTVKSIIQNHQGHIHVESKKRQGTTFHIMLPAILDASEK